MNKYLDKAGLQDFATKLTEKYKTLFSSPLTASTVAGMTDHTKVYVYTGSETGYTSGHWYFWNGSAWADGGVYNAEAINTDTTLSISGAAADAKKVGDEITGLKSAYGETTRNLFTDEYSSFTSMELVNDKVKNTNTDTRSYFLCLIRFRNETTNVTISSPKSFETIGRKSVTVTPEGDGNNLYILHNGGTRILGFVVPFNFVSGTTYTISFDLEACDPRDIGGLILSNIQIEVGSTATPYIPHKTAVDKIARLDISAINENIVANEADEAEEIFNYTLSASKRSQVTLPRGLYKIESNIITDDNFIVFKLEDSNNVVIYAVSIYRNEPVKYIYIPTETQYVSIVCYSAPGVVNYENDTIKLSVVHTPDMLSMPVQQAYIRSGEIDVGSAKQGMWSYGGFIPSQAGSNRIGCGPYNYFGKFTMSLSDYTTYRFGIDIYRLDNSKFVYDSGWKTNDFEFIVDAGCFFTINISKNDNTALSPSDLSSIGLSITSDCYFNQGTNGDISELQEDISELQGDVSTTNLQAIQSLFPGRFKPCYDHLFVSKTGNDIVIPHESLYHVRISRKLGFNTIEANVASTSDGVYIVNHLSSGKFGGYFHHVDGTTDISDVSLSDVTWEWVVNNVRYNSTIEKYRTRPCRLEEFLGECRQQNIIPFLGKSNYTAVRNIADSIMGKGNYIAYSGDRSTTPSAIICHWKDNLSTAADILAYCETIGRPFIYGLAHPWGFTDSELEEIISTLHANGYWIATSYADGYWHKYSHMGFDFLGTQTLINRIEVGNLHNIESIFGFDDFTYDNATETNGVLTFTSAGNIYPDIDNTTYDVCAIDVEIWFDGSITFYAIGELANNTSFTSDGSQPVFLSIPIINGSPKWHIVASSGCTVYDIKFKASVV